MKKFTSFEVFNAMIKFLLQQISISEDRSVLDVISDLDCNIWEDGMPANKLLWDDWEEILLNIGSKNDLIKERLLDVDQGAFCMCFFLEKTYWEKNNDTLLSVVISDLNQNFYKKNDFESNVWKNWLLAVEESKKFQSKMIF